MNEILASRREWMTSIGAGLAVMSLPGFVFPGQEAGEEGVPCQGVRRTTAKSLDWETLAADEWLTPQDQVFNVQHYGTPEVDVGAYELEIAGMVERPRKLRLAQIRSLPKEDRLMTLECSGNGSNPGFTGAVYNSKWSGTPLLALLKECGIKSGATE